MKTPSTIHLLPLALCVSSETFAAKQDLPPFVNWTYDGAYQQDNGLRTMICLNGWWRWQLASGKSEDAPPAQSWQYRKAPGIGVNFHILDREGQSLLKGKNRDDRRKLSTGTCWVERELMVPSAWQSRPVQIVFQSINGDGEIWIDGTRMGHTWPGRAHHFDLPKPYRADKPYRLSIKSDGVIGNVWLKSYAPTDGRIEDSYLTTSTRNMTATIRAAGRGPAGATVRAVITDYKDPGRTVKTAGPFAVQAKDGQWQLNETFPWKGATLWSLSRPHLYKYHVELTDANGTVVDRIFPIRFGFREVWIKGGHFMLNNRRITLTMDIHSRIGTKSGYSKMWLRAGNPAREEVWRKAFRRWKRLGVNTVVHRWSALVDDDTIFRMADEEGFFVSVGLSGLQYGNPDFMKIPAVRKHAEDRMRYQILPRRHCPSVPFYYIASTSNTWDFEPKKLGEDYDTEAVFGRHNRPERTLVAKLDPVRVAFAGSGGGKAALVHSSMNYIHIDADLQVHETWPSYWHRKQRKPLATYEMAAPPYIANWYQRRSRGEQAHGTRGVLPDWLEVSAIYFGEQPYLAEPKENIEKWLSRVGTDKGQFYPKWWVKCYEEAARLFTRNLYRSWRTYGVNMGFFTQVRAYYDGKPFYVEPLDVDPRRPGMLADGRISLGDPLKEEPLSPVGEVARRALSPLLMYIGGPDGEFTKKDRAYYTGETVRKAAVILNDRNDPATVSGTWKLQSSGGHVALRGSLPQTRLTPGELAPAKVHISFTAPAVNTRTEYVLKLHGQSKTSGSLEDEFRLTVFPKPAPAAVPGGMKVFLYDPLGDTKGVLERAGISFTMLAGTLPDPHNSLLVIGRNALKDEADHRAFSKLLYRKMGYDFGINVSNGMRVLVFEQAMDNLWGLTTEQTRWRRAFIIAPGHPVFRGLGRDDFLYLRGDSNLAEAYPDAPPGKAGRVATDRFSEWGNDNVVTTYALIRPQLGAMRALVACGFDQQETPLLEVAAGKGRLMFCQIDVTNRYGVDPVSTQLVNNLLTYLTTVEPPDPSVGKPTDLVREGWEDYDVDVKKERVFMVDKPEGPISWGVSAADLYFEGCLDLPVIQSADGKTHLYCRIEGEKQLAHTLNRRNFKTKWQKMKSLMVRAALQINQGGTSETFPSPSFQGDDEALYPLEWVEGFVHPYLMMQW